MKTIFLFTVVIAIAIFSSLGCITKQVWKDDGKSNPYRETIVAFYINHPKKEIAFLGEQYHYIFNEKTEIFSQLIEKRASLKLTQKNLHIHSFIQRNDNRVIYSDIDVRFFANKLNPQQIAWVEAHQFRKYKLSETEYAYIQNYHIKGIRYQIDRKVNAKAMRLKTPIILEVNDWKIEKKSNLYKIAMTPLSLTGDAVGGVIMLGAVIVMSPIWLYEAITR